mmetsp:Transcript_11756/g.15339  ORF Transcript_11756/g.15339 Transcript_11756/m.15339 type:complete len:93 (+) Transcript_11756:131-409(+)
MLHIGKIGNRKRNSLCAERLWITTNQAATAASPLALLPAHQLPISVRGTKGPQITGSPCDTNQCHGCEPKAALPPSITLNLTKFQGVNVKLP